MTRIHSLFPTEADAQAQPEQIFSDHLPIITQYPLSKKHGVRVLSWNVMGKKACSFSAFKGNDEEPAASARYERIKTTLGNIVQEQMPNVILLQENDITVAELRATLGDHWKIHTQSGVTTCFNKNEFLVRTPTLNNTGYDVFLMSVDNEASLEGMDLDGISWSKRRVPLLIKAGNEFIIWGYIDGLWQKTKLSAAEGGAFMSLPFPDVGQEGRAVNQDDPLLTEEIFDALSQGHTRPYDPAIHPDANPVWDTETKTLSIDLLHKATSKKVTIGNNWGNFSPFPWKNEEIFKKKLLEVHKKGADLGIMMGDTNSRIAPKSSTPQNIATGLIPHGFVASDPIFKPIATIHPAAQFVDFPDGGFYITKKKGIIRQLITKALNYLGRVHEEPLTDPELCEQAILKSDYKAVMCLDPYYQKAKFINNKTIFQYEEKLRRFMASKDVYVRATANHRNEKGLSIAFGKHSMLYEVIKAQLGNDDACQFVELTCNKYNLTHRCVFVPQAKIALLHATISQSLNSEKFAYLLETRILRDKVLSDIDQRIKKLSRIGLFTVKFPEKAEALTRLRTLIANVPLDVSMECSVICTANPPRADRLEDFPTKANRSYVMTEEGIYYIEKSIKKCVLVSADPEVLQHYKDRFNLAQSEERVLSEEALTEVSQALNNITVHSTIATPRDIICDQYNYIISKWKQQSVFTKNGDAVCNEALMGIHRGILESTKSTRSEGLIENITRLCTRA